VKRGAGLFEIMVGRAKKCLWGIWLCSGLALCVWNAESAGGGADMAASKDACFIKTFRAKIVPERLRSFVMPADGVVSNWIPADGRVQKDTITRFPLRMMKARLKRRTGPLRKER